MTESSFIDLLRTAWMQAQLAIAVYRGPVAVEALGAEHGALTSRYIRAGNIACGWLVFRDHIHLSVSGSFRSLHNLA